MATSIRAFNVDLYQEHLLEAAFLYQHRVKLLLDPEIRWRDLVEVEDRLEAHIDALVIGEDLAIEVCRARAKSGDSGELFPAISVFCRQRRADLVSEALAGSDFTDGDKVAAIEDALKHELPNEWMGYCGEALAR